MDDAQSAALQHLRAAYFGPEGGDCEVLLNRPHLQYSVGMLFPSESNTPEPSANGTASSKLPEGEVEEDGAAVPLAEDWRPSSIAISFVTDTDSVLCSVSGGTYESVGDDGPPCWQRSPFAFDALSLSEGCPPHQLVAANVPFEVGARWRPYRGSHLVTIHARLTAESTGNDKLDIEMMLFQVALSVKPDAGGRILEYDVSRLDTDDESAELRVRYRDRKVFAVGHGMAADWESKGGVCESVWLTPVPTFVVPAVETTGFPSGTEEARALRLEELARIDSAPEEILPALDAFVCSFSTWAAEQETRTDVVGDPAAIARITGRSKLAADRMAAGVQLLRDPGSDILRRSFALGMAAMQLQMRQSALARGDGDIEPQWRPFQLGFLLVSLASTVTEDHDDRELVDLIWFPTGGGKTEAYLALAAVELFRRRLVYGTQGGGTAVITRYTLRLLTSQQFQRAAALICAMEILRHTDARAKPMSRFSIGLWVGNEATPATRLDARNALDRLLKAARPDEANEFQVEGCPWCLAPLVPRVRTEDRSRYGLRLVGNDVVIHCTSDGCPFSEELPLAVVDDVLYDDPPSILLATVDKFARLQFKPEAGRLLGLGSGYRQPSLVIQDELHLLSGPLGTTVAVFDAVIQLLLSRDGSKPKIVASTATIRSSNEQVRGLYGRRVALYPPAGLDDDKTFFSRPVESGEGRLYAGLMPQSVSQASALVSSVAPMVELPAAISAAVTTSGVDAYWTLVMYHNSLRELGRSGTLVVDDVNGRLGTRADRLGLALRYVRTDRVLELTSRRGPEELPNDLRELRSSADESSQAIDVVLSSNMLSVGIDVPRLALMLMVGQPKTTAEYIQATSRVGRGRHHGIVVTLFRSNRARDRSHFETFRGYHDALYRGVEPTSVTPWSLSSRKRSLAGALVALLRHSLQSLSAETAAGHLNLGDPKMGAAIHRIIGRFLVLVAASDEAETQDVTEETWKLLREWDFRAKRAREASEDLRYSQKVHTEEALVRRFGDDGEGWFVADSMRSVEPNVAVEVREPFEEARRAED